MPTTINGTTGVSQIQDDTVTIPKIDATGTPSNTTFLRGDGTWAAAGGGSDIQTFNANGTWTKPSTGSLARIQVWGGGGGAGRGVNVGVTGGGGGGYNEIVVPLSSLGATVAVTIGAGGAKRSGSVGNGSAGGNSSFGSVLSAFGGGGGVGSSSAHSFADNVVLVSGYGGGPLAAGVTPSLNEDLETAMTRYASVGPSSPILGMRGFSTQSVISAYGLYNGGTDFTGNFYPRKGSAIYGGGAGACQTGFSTGAGLSLYGGNGGATGADGVAPAGGGGAAISADGGNGAAGRVVVTVW